MTFDLLFLIPAGIVAGVAGTVGGVASLVSFPALLALGFSPLVANTTNTLGGSMVGVGASLGYRREIAREGRLAVSLCVAGASGAVVGAAILLLLGDRVFERAVPIMLVAASLLILAQPLLVRRAAAGHGSRGHDVATCMATFFGSIYGGYFGAGLGLILVGVFGTLLQGGLQRAIALKTAVAVFVNAGTVLVFVIWAPIAYWAALCLGVSCFAGGYLGSHVARRLPDRAIRVCTVLLGFGAAAYAAFR